MLGLWFLLDFFPNQENRIIIHDITLTFQEMKYEELKMLPPEDFRRFCGVKPETFAAMLLALQEDYQKKHRWTAPKLSEGGWIGSGSFV